MADEPLGRMVIELGLDHSDFGKGLQGAKNEVKYAMADMKSAMSVIGQSGNKLDVLGAKAKGLTSVMSAQQSVVQKLGKSYNDSFVNGKATAQTGKLATQLQNANAKLASLATQYKNNAAAMAKARVETTGFTGGLNKISKSAITVGTSMSNIGSKMTSKVSVPVVAGLTLATKAAVDFDSQIQQIGPLLTNGGAVTAKFKAQLDEMSTASKNWSKTYGVSTTEINNAMAELVRRGYTTAQVLGSMPAILNATKASGEDMGTVMNATASIVEQFGLKSSSTAATLKNTTMVTDALTYAANATASGFGDMSEAMKYVGPIASSLGMSVQQTAAAIGVLSNRGIEGQKAGTGLRGILTSLVKPTAMAQSAFKKMGISTKELATDSHDLPKLINDISKGTEGWTRAEKNKALAQAFGKENQTAMNALVAAGSKSLQDLTDKTNAAGGATKKVADQMNNTSANNVKKLTASLQVLGIEIGEKLVPKLLPLVNDVTKAVDGFSDLDDSTQDTIIKFALLAAAAGPVLGVVGKLTSGFGLVGKGIVGTVSKFAQMSARSKAASEVMEILGGSTKSVSGQLKVVAGGATGATSALNKINGTVSSVNGSVATAKTGFSVLGTALTTTEAGAGVLGSSLTVAGAALAGVGVAAVAGAAIWYGYGKSASESAQRTKEWGSDIGATASDAANDFGSFETKASTALTDFGNDAKSTAKTVQTAFKGMVTSASKNVDKTYSNAKKEADKVGGAAGAAILKQAEKEHTANEKRITDMQKTAKQVDAITSASAKTGVKLTSDQVTTIGNLQRKMAQDEIETLNLKSKQKKAVLAAELGETTTMTKKQLASTEKAIGDASYKEMDAYNKQTGELHKAQQKGNISTAAMNAGLEVLQKKHNATMTQLGEDYIRTGKAQGKSMSDITTEMSQNGFTDSQAQASMKAYLASLKQTAGSAIKITGDMSKSTRSAAESWNKMVLDPKTGKVKTNAQEEVDKAAKSKDKWNSMMLLLKKGEMSSNAAAMVGVAAVQTGKWNGLSLKEKQAMIRSKGGDDLAKLITDGKQWNKFTPTEKKAIISAKGGSELLQVMTSAKTWNKLTLTEKKAVIKDNATTAMKQANINLQKWNDLTPRMKTVMATAKGTSDVAKGIKSVEDWNSLPTKEKRLLANDSNATEALKRAGVNYKQYQNLPKNVTKNLLAKDSASKNASKAKISVGKYGQLKVSSKNLKAIDKASGPSSKATGSVKKFSSTKVGAKNLTSHDKTSSPVGTARKSLTRFNGTKVLSKTATGHDKTSSPINSARGSLTRFNGTKVLGKTAVGHDSASRPMGTARASVTRFNGTPISSKTARGVNAASGPIGSAISAVKNFMSLPSLISKTVQVIHKVITGKATGSMGTDGNPIMVNDQEGPVFRELVKYPGAVPFIPHGRNVILNAPKNTKVIPAGLTAQMYRIPQYAKGTISPNSSVLQAAQLVNDATSVTPVSNPVSVDNGNLLQQIIASSQQQSELLKALINAVGSIHLTDKMIANANQRYTATNLKLSNYGKGITGL